ncbi:cytochrome P450 4F5 [Mycena sanguinolenta]|nr:cytochrome P450 4F5 [Mycena sanguinolenta]
MALLEELIAIFNQIYLWLYGISCISKAILVLALLAVTTHYQLSCPRKLRHLKRVSPYAMLWSYAIRESVGQRVRRLILPLAEEGETAVAVYMLGKWGVHLLDPALIKQVCHEHTRFPKKNYQEHLHFTFLSGPNVVFSNGKQWQRYSASIKGAFDRHIPIHVFAEFAEEVLKKIGKGGICNVMELVQKFTLDSIGRSALGYSFDALASSANNELPLVDHFNRVMSRIGTPVTLMFPVLDTVLPRKIAINDLNALNARYDNLLAEKRSDLGQDILSYLLEDTSLSHEELRSNLAILFSAGHDTTSSGLGTAVYHLAIDSELQSAVRAEVCSVLGERTEPTLADLKRLPLLDAVIHESLRINPPVSLLPARMSDEDVVVLGTYLPGGVPLVLNVYAAHHTKREHSFRASRFLSRGEGTGVVHGSFMPFGTGPRQCPARHFALFEQRTLLAMLVAKYKFSLPPGSVHEDRLHNEFGAFGLSVPRALHLEFTEL